MSRVDALLANFKQRNKASIATLAELRQERDARLAKAQGGQQGGGARAGGSGAGAGAGWCWWWQRGLPGLPCLACCRCNAHHLPSLASAAGRGGRGGKATAGRGARKAASTASGDASTASGAPAGADWKQRSRQAQPSLPLGVKIKAVVDFLRASAEPQQASAIAGTTSL
jgi:hypothetical protein